VQEKLARQGALELFDVAVITICLLQLQGIYSKLLKGKEGKYADGSDHFSALDVVVGYSLNLANRGGLLADAPELKSYADKIAQHPHFAASHVEPK
jgi:glutathione S-transferase